MPYPAQTDRATIVATAQRLIEGGGVDQLSLSQLASELGIKAPSLYRHVASKTALLAAVITLTLDQLFAAYAAAGVLPAGEAPPTDRAEAIRRLEVLLAVHRTFAHANPHCYVLAFSATEPELRADQRWLEQQVLPVEALMAVIVGPERALTALRGAMALVHGFVMLELGQQLRRGGDLDAAFAAAVEAYLAGWAADERRD